MERKGWFIIAGVQEGDRTLEEQMIALQPALEETRGKGLRVLDLGCAEGLIGREFSRAGAEHVLGIDSVKDHLAEAQRQCKGLRMRFEQHDFNFLAARLPVERFDVVLALGVVHKLHRPEEGVRYAARSCAGLLLMRSGRGAVKGVITSKHRKNNSCDSHALLKAEGFVLEKIEAGPAERGEDVEYWRRK